VMELADQVVVLDFADEQSVVQTRFATTAVALLLTLLLVLLLPLLPVCA